jgi:tetratricopeptide (TPR) repeat protein
MAVSAVAQAPDGAAPARRRSPARLAALAVMPAVLAALGWGCRLPYSKGPVPESVATCRQLTQQAVAAVERGHYEQAESLLAKAVKLNPADPEARRRYADVLGHRGARQQAVEQLQEAMRVAPDDAGLKTRLAEFHLEMGRSDQALQTIEQAIDLDPKSAAAWAVRARVFQASGDRRTALADFHRALAYAPDDRRTLLDLAELHRQSNEPHRAMQTLQSLAETYAPGEEPQRVLYLLGLAQMAVGRYADAAEQFAAAAARRPPKAEVLYALAEAERGAGRPAQAAAAAEEALRLDPEHQASRELLERIRLATPQPPPSRL